MKAQVGSVGTFNQEKAHLCDCENRWIVCSFDRSIQPTLQRLWQGSEWRQLLRVILVKSCRNQWTVGIAVTLSSIYYLEWCLLTGAWHCWGHWYDVQWSGTLWVVSLGRPHTTPSDGVTWRRRGYQGTRPQHEEPPCCLHSQDFRGNNDGGCFL